MFLYKAIIDHHNEPMKARVGGYTIGFTPLKGRGLFGVSGKFLQRFIARFVERSLSLHVSVYVLGFFTNVLHPI
ncbi:MAG: hypothetical protein Ct9H90mP14_2080 [Methanobacteriota archaeon]|nr:MAG: hypothetical protein Ct9H90mP14_2080 [Euryarchaeota archaeon]